MVVGKPFFTVNQIQEKVRELGGQISADYKGQDLLVVPILKGAFLFASDLIRHITTPLTVDFVLASSYVKSETSGDVQVHCELRERVTDRNILLIEDIIDTGITLNYLRERIMEQRPKSLRICGLLDKKERRMIDVPIDYVGFTIPNVFVVGYGLDYDNKYRNLPYIAIFKKSQ
jgi:hypoxanthine phosphoribosyltransferase